MRAEKKAKNMVVMKSVVALLHQEGMTQKTEVIRRTGISITSLSSMRRFGHVDFSESDAGVQCEATNFGRQTFGIEKDRTGLTPGRFPLPPGEYDGAEMKPFSSRAGANDASALPSHGCRC